MKLKALVIPTSQNTVSGQPQTPSSREPNEPRSMPPMRSPEAHIQTATAVCTARRTLHGSPLPRERKSSSSPNAIKISIEADSV